MDFVTRSKEGDESSEEAMVERLKQFVEDSDLSFYEIASRIGISAGILSMLLARKARPHADSGNELGYAILLESQPSLVGWHQNSRAAGSGVASRFRSPR